jgi:hypothetical protein
MKGSIDRSETLSPASSPSGLAAAAEEFAESSL